MWVACPKMPKEKKRTDIHGSCSTVWAWAQAEACTRYDPSNVNSFNQFLYSSKFISLIWLGVDDSRMCVIFNWFYFSGTCKYNLFSKKIEELAMQHWTISRHREVSNASSEEVTGLVRWRWSKFKWLSMTSHE